MSEVEHNSNHSNKNYAPWPTALETLIDHVTYKKGWVFYLSSLDRGQGSVGLTLCIRTTNPDSYHPETMRSVMHYMIVPAACYDERSWRRWLLEQILMIERHEACEFFQIDGERPYAPHHGPGNDPYIVFDHGDDIDVRTSYLGMVKEPA
jgi:hypothetical protein